MTRDDAEKLLPIIKAYSEGKEIQHFWENKWEDIKADMIAKGLKGKEYIHSIGKWNDYIDYLRKELREKTYEN